MSTMQRVTEIFKVRLEKDSSEQMTKAGEIWSDLPFNFYYLIHGDDTVDIVITRMARQVAKDDGITLPAAVIRNLQALVGPKTIVKDAIRLIFLTTFQPASD